MSDHYIGIDIHKEWCVFTEIDAKGTIIERGKFGNNSQAVLEFASRLSKNKHLVVEPVLNYLWLLDHFEPYAGSYHVATPYKVRVIAESKCKTDKYDSRILAELLRTNFLPESWVPPKSLRSLRDTVRQRFHLVKMTTMLKNRIRHILLVHGCKVRAKDISSKSGRRAITALVLSDTARQSIEQCLKSIELFQQLVAELDNQLTAQSLNIPEIALLQTIPGVGAVWGITIYTEIGDITRFHSDRALASYTGLVPSVRASGNTVRHGGITHLGSKPLRHALVEVAIDVIRKSPALNRLFQRVLYRSNVQKARVAVARKLATIIYVMLKRNEPFRCEAA